MTSLDLGTVILLHKTSLLAGSGTLLLLWFRVDRPPDVAMIASAFATLAIGALLAGLGEHNLIPPPSGAIRASLSGSAPTRSFAWAHGGSTGASALFAGLSF